MKYSTYLGLLAWPAAMAKASSTEFYYTLEMTSNSDPLDLSMTSNECADACQVGDSIMISGDLTIYEEFTQTVCYSFEFSAFGSTSTATGSYDFCELVSAESVDGSTECPEPGEYTFSMPLTVTSLSAGVSMHLDVDIYDCDGSENIDIAIDAYVYSIYYTTVYGSLGIVSLIGAFMYRKRRRIEVANADGDGDHGLQETESHFEMMSDRGVTV